jgi:spermidine synthase
MRPGLWLPLLAFGSGVAALLYETVWIRWFRLLFGSTAYSASATLCAFFAGMALGAFLFARLTARSSRPLRLYGWVEIGAGLAALVVPLVFMIYEPLYAALYGSLMDEPGALLGAKIVLALAGMIPPATLLGGTLPPLAAAFVSRAAGLGTRGNALYGINTLGAALGTALGALWLPEWIGLRATYGLAIALSLGIGLAAFALARRVPAREVSLAPDRGPGVPGDRAAWGLLAIAFLSGVGTLVFEILLLQTLSRLLESSVYSVGATLLVVLLTLASAAFIVAALPRAMDIRRALTVVLLVEALLLVATPLVAVGPLGTVESEAPSVGRVLAIALALGGPALCVGGLVFPLTLRLARGGDPGARLGRLIAANTLGGIVGSLSASFVLLDTIGLWSSFLLLSLGYASATVIAARTPTRRLVFAAAGFGAFAALVASPLSPTRLPAAAVVRGENVIALEEDAHGVVVVTESVEREFKINRMLRIDGHYVLSSALADRHQRRLGHIPILLQGAARRALFIGSATGETAASALSHPIEEIVLVEMVPAVRKLAADHFADVNRGVYEHPRSRVIIEDGRNHVRASPDRYDVMVADLFVPWRPGTGSMYALEHFRAAREHLSPDGVFAQWLPLYQFDAQTFQMVVETFLEVFPDAVVWRGDFFAGNPTAALVGFRGSPPSATDLEKAIARFAATTGDDRWVADSDALWTLYLGPLATLRSGSDVNTDDRPLFEYLAARSESAMRRRFVDREWPAHVAALLEAVDAGRGPWQPESETIEAARAIAQANAMLWSDGARRAEAAALLRASVPPALLEEHDWTVMETWPFVR